jgi:hypothetical protein
MAVITTGVLLRLRSDRVLNLILRQGEVRFGSLPLSQFLALFKFLKMLISFTKENS